MSRPEGRHWRFRRRYSNLKRALWNKYFTLKPLKRRFAEEMPVLKTELQNTLHPWRTNAKTVRRSSTIEIPDLNAHTETDLTPKEIPLLKADTGIAYEMDQCGAS